MLGPQPLGHWSALSSPDCGKSYKHLVTGRVYVVLKEFVDFDGVLHRPGERWQFLGYAFLPYDDGLSLFVSLDNTHEWHIRMHCVPEGQASIIEAFEQYVGNET